MKKYNFNIDKPNPTKKDTDKFKNFDNLVSDYKQLHSPWRLLKVMYSDRKVIRLLILIIAVAVAVVFSLNERDKLQSKEKTEVEK